MNRGESGGAIALEPLFQLDTFKIFDFRAAPSPRFRLRKLREKRGKSQNNLIFLKKQNAFDERKYNIKEKPTLRSKNIQAVHFHRLILI